MAINFSDIKKFSKNHWDVVIGKYDINIPAKNIVVMNPIIDYTETMKIFSDITTYKYLIKELQTAPVLKTNIEIYNYHNNIITKLKKSRISNKPGNVPFEDLRINLFSEMDLNFDEEIFLFVPRLSGYEKVSIENRARVFLADMESLIDSKSSDEDFSLKLKNKLSKITLITSEFFDSCPLEEYFNNVYKFKHIMDGVNYFVENYFGRIISSGSTSFNKIIQCNVGSIINCIGIEENKKTKIISRSEGRIQFSGEENESGYFVFVGQNINTIGEYDTNFPLIVIDEFKSLLTNLAALIRIISNLSDDDKIKRSILKKEYDFVIDYLMNKFPYKEDDTQLNKKFKIVNNLIKTYYPRFVNYLSENRVSPTNTPELPKPTFLPSTSVAPHLGRHISSFH